MKRWVLKPLILIVCLAALVWTVRSLGPRKVLDAAANANPWWLAASVAAVVARYAVWAVKWRTMVRREGAFGFADAARTLMVGVFVNLTTPTAKLAGGFVRAALVRRRTGWGLARCYGWSFADQFTNSLGNCFLGGALLLATVVTRPGTRDRGLLLGLGIAAVVGVSALVALRGAAWRRASRPESARWLARLTPSRFRVAGPDGERAAWLEPVLAPLLKIGRTSRVVPLDLGLAAISCGCLCVANACALEAVGLDVPVLPAAAAMVLAGFAGTVAGTMGGIGATELALIGLYGHLDIPRDAAAAAALLHRAAYYLVSLGLGGAALAAESRNRGTLGE